MTSTLLHPIPETLAPERRPPAARAVAAVGNYAELLERNVGPRSSLGLERGLNRLSVQGGLIQSPPFR